MNEHSPAGRACPGWMRLLRRRLDAAAAAVITRSKRSGPRSGTHCAGLRPAQTSYPLGLNPRTLTMHIPVHVPVQRDTTQLTLIIIWWVTHPLLVTQRADHLEAALGEFVRNAVHQILADHEGNEDLLALRHRVATVLRRIRGAGVTGLYWYALNVRARHE